MLLTERKTLLIEVKADIAKREVEAYASTFGNVDRGRDRVLKGAYLKTIERDGPTGDRRIKVRRNHEAAIGKPIHMEEDSKGLLTVSKISKTPLGDETLCLIEDGVVDRMSIGYRVDGVEGKRYVTEGGEKIRELVQLQIDEYSLLDVPPMNDQATIVGVKSLYDVSCVLDQMQSAVYALQRLASLPADVAARVATLVRDLQALPSVDCCANCGMPAGCCACDSAYVDRQAAQVASLSSLLSEFTNSLSTTNS